MNSDDVKICQEYISDHPNGFYLEEVKFKEIQLTQSLSLLRDFLAEYPKSDYKKAVSVMKDNIDDNWLSEIKKNPKTDKCINYLNQFSDGKHIEEVRFILVKIEQDIRRLRSFRYNYPKSRFLPEIEKIKDTLWDKQIANYDKRVKFKTKASRFFKKFMLFLKQNDQDELIIKFNRIVKVKDFHNYNANIRTKLDNQNKNSGYKRMVTGNVASVEYHFTLEKMLSYEDIVFSSIKKAVNNIVSEDFLECYNDSNSDTKNRAVITINYIVENDENSGIPHIWIYSENNNLSSRPGKFISYVLGISVNFNFNISIPEPFLDYSFNHKASPTDNINFVTDLKEGYTKMTSQTFQKFAEQIKTRFKWID
ncbi:hypothetical protein OAM07_03535 [Crocinitomicaceae bacterium]|nr:hypothetical protein [Crocinitomicaceae bacterium]